MPELFFLMKHTKKKFTKFFFLSVFTFLVSFAVFSNISCSSLRQEPLAQVSSVSDISRDLQWKTLTDYAETADFFITEKKTLCHLVRINLLSENFSIVSFPDTKKDSSIRAKKFAKQNDCDIVINTTPFSQKIRFISKQVPAGIIYSNNEQLYKPNARYSALAFYNDGTKYSAKIIERQSDEQLTLALKQSPCIIHGGFWQILKDGEVIDFKDIKDSRTALGISRDGTKLYILIVEGERKSTSLGLSYMECARILLENDCYNAIQFDGGNSSCLILDQKNALSYPKNPNLSAFLGFCGKK